MGEKDEIVIIVKIGTGADRHRESHVDLEEVDAEDSEVAAEEVDDKSARR